MDLALNRRAAVLAGALARRAAALRVGVEHGPAGERLLDCGHRHLGSTEAGLWLARITLGGLAEVALVPSPPDLPPWSVAVRTAQPVAACLASQYAGWTLDGLMGSGPARALARREAVFERLEIEERSDRAVLVLEGETPPPASVTLEVAEACGVEPARVTLLHAPTGSPAGMAQIAARAIECALQKALHLGLDLSAVQEAVALAPLCAPHPDVATAMGRANDAIIYGAEVGLVVSGSAESARDLAEQLPSSTSPDWGRGFAEVYAEAEGDFAHIDSRLFSPARVSVTALQTGETFRAGRLRPAQVAL
jgi:methenyltetrahydromethanopterin cyclohydrolase